MRSTRSSPQRGLTKADSVDTADLLVAYHASFVKSLRINGFSIMPRIQRRIFFGVPLPSIDPAFGFAL